MITMMMMKHQQQQQQTNINKLDKKENLPTQIIEFIHREWIQWKQQRCEKKDEKRIRKKKKSINRE